MLLRVLARSGEFKGRSCIILTLRSCAKEGFSAGWLNFCQVRFLWLTIAKLAGGWSGRWQVLE